MARIKIITAGCTHNTADSERMGGLLVEAGHTIVEDESDADLLLLNSCAVKTPTEDRFRNILQKTRNDHRLKVVIAGCVPEGERKDPFLQQFSAIGTKSIDKVVEVVESTLRGEMRRVFERNRLTGLSLPRVKKNPLITIIPINSGCLGSCTYCKTIQARGRLQSHTKQDILLAIEDAVAKGGKEIWITSEDVGAWGIDLGSNLPELLKEIAKLRGGFMVRIGMANPEHVIRYLDQLLSIIKENPKRFFRFLHIPVQSGSDSVLKDMGRKYDSKTFIEIVRQCKESMADITLITDYIVGYPTESLDDFSKTKEVMNETDCRFINITKFYPRPGTPAKSLKPLPTKEVARRCADLVRRYEEIDHNKVYLETVQEAFFTEVGKRGELIGHTENYIQVIVNVPERERSKWLGFWRTVKIFREKKFYIEGSKV